MDTIQICKAISKQSKKQCKNFATKGKCVCRIHGGRSTGAKTVEGLQRKKMASWKHGFRSKEAKAEARGVKSLIKLCEESLR